METHRVELNVELRSFAQRRFDAAYFGYLTADMEMNQFQAIFHVLLIQKVQRFQQLAGGQAEFAGIASALFPLSTAG